MRDKKYLQYRTRINKILRKIETQEYSYIIWRLWYNRVEYWLRSHGKVPEFEWKRLEKELTFFEYILNGKPFEECEKIIADLPETIDTNEIWKLERRYEKRKEIKSWKKRKKRKENIMNVLKRKLEHLQGDPVILKKKDLKNPWRGVYIFFILKLIEGYRYVVSKGGNIIITNREDVVDLYNSGKGTRVYEFKGGKWYRNDEPLKNVL